mmetsp:Transcript_64308/g.112136  ORF Transcript_64308/g.112136 Transcript_64308/m.112136 type:complete len:462 (+) Transcript_64308:84-1469(+)
MTSWHPNTGRSRTSSIGSGVSSWNPTSWAPTASYMMARGSVGEREDYIGSWSAVSHKFMTKSWEARELPDALPVPSWIYPVSFFLGVALTMPWFTINGAVKAFVIILGKDCYMRAQAAYFGPQLLVLMVQTAFDYKLDAALGLRGGVICRVTLSFTAISFAVIWLAVLETSLPLLLAVSFIIGTFQAIGLGGICQLAARFSPLAVISFQVGYGFAPVLVILSDAVTGFHLQEPLSVSNVSFYGIASVVPLLGLLLTLRVLFSQAAQPFLKPPPAVSLLNQGGGDFQASQAQIQTVAAILGCCWQSVLASYLNFTMGLFVLCLLPYIKGPAWMTQTIVLVNLSSNLLGRALSLSPAVLYRFAGTPCRNLQTMMARLVFALPFILYLLGTFGEMDYVAVVYVGLIAMTAGFISSSVYSSACRATPKASQPRATLLVNLAMLSGIYTAIIFSIMMSSFGWVPSH